MVGSIFSSYIHRDTQDSQSMASPAHIYAPSRAQSAASEPTNRRTSFHAPVHGTRLLDPDWTVQVAREQTLGPHMEPECPMASRGEPLKGTGPSGELKSRPGCLGQATVTPGMPPSPIKDNNNIRLSSQPARPMPLMDWPTRLGKKMALRGRRRLIGAKETMPAADGRYNCHACSLLTLSSLLLL